ncbi:MAG: DUF1638 domain-containing protein [Thermoguttaceae bacterium]
MRLKLIACEILFREFCAAAAVSKNRIDVEFLPKGLHDIGRNGMSRRLSEAIASVNESDYDAILLGYCLCSGGVVGLSAKTIPLVIPRAHDCITLFLGDKKRYQDYFSQNSGVYFKTTGWIERGDGLFQGDGGKSGLSYSRESLIEKYGAENGTYIWNQLAGMSHYSKLAFIETGLEPDDSFEAGTRQLAAERNWTFEKLTGDLSLIHRLLDGSWNESDFLVVSPGEKIEFSYDDNIIVSL